jgi:hypothetical protein
MYFANMFLSPQSAIVMKEHVSPRAVPAAVRKFRHGTAPGFLHADAKMRRSLSL